MENGFIIEINCGWIQIYSRILLKLDAWQTLYRVIVKNQTIEKYSELFMDFDKTQLGTLKNYWILVRFQKIDKKLEFFMDFDRTQLDALQKFIRL